MPALHFPHQPSSADADTRIIESRQLANAARTAARSLSTHAHHLWRRWAPLLLRRDKNYVYCKDRFISACYAGLGSGPSPGAIVGIVLGSIAGFLIVMYLLFILSSGTTFIRTSALEVEEDVVVTRNRSRSPRSRRGQRSSYNVERSSYNQETRRVSSPRRDRDRVIRQERIVRDVPPPRRESSRMQETTINVQESSRGERRVEGDDVVEVLEEESSISGAPPPRRQSRRGSSYR